MARLPSCSERLGWWLGDVLRRLLVEGGGHGVGEELPLDSKRGGIDILGPVVDAWSAAGASLLLGIAHVCSVELVTWVDF